MNKNILRDGLIQTARSWPQGNEEDRQQGELLAKKIERIGWRLWPGRPQGALDLIDAILRDIACQSAKSS